MNLVKTILELSAYSSVMIIVILALKAVFKGKISLKIIVVLWMLVLMRLLIPFTFSSPLHLDSLIKMSAESTANEPEAALDNSENTHLYEAEEYRFEDTGSTALLSADESLEVSESEANSIAVQKSFFLKTAELMKTISLWVYFAIIWAAGSLIFGLVSLWNFISFNSLVEGCTEAEESTAEAIKELKRQLKIKQDVKAVVCKYVGAPVTFRVFKPVIILPLSLASRISEEKLNMILLHELCHIKRKDMLYNVFWMIAKIIHWFNPLVWVGYNSYLEDIELSCDEMVNSYLDSEQSFVYSQSLIDVIRFSRNIGRLPAALSFCEDKSKLRKRVENMLKPQKKLKSAGGISLFLALIMIIACFTTACQPTPQKTIVQNKNDGELEAGIMETAAPNGTSQQIESDEPIIILQDVSSNASNTVTVDIDAVVVNNQPDKIPVAQIKSSPYTKEELMHMIEVFFGNTELFTRDWVKEDYEYFILQKQYEMNDPEQLQAYADDRGITDLSVAKEQIQDTIDRAKSNMADAPAQRNTAEIEPGTGFDLLINTRDGFLGNVRSDNIMTAFNDNDNCYMLRSLNDFEYISPDIKDSEFLYAKQLATDLISEMGIDHVKYGDAYKAQDVSFTDSGPYWNGREYYVFCFDTIIADSVLDCTRNIVTPPALVDLSGKDGYEDVPEVQYAEMIPYDRLEVWVEGDKIVQFKHRYPIEVTSIINENVAIAVDYEEAAELAKQFAYYAFIDKFGNYSEYILEIYKIELSLVRIKEKDTGNDIVVPAWNFCGALKGKINPENEYMQQYADENGLVIIGGGVEGANDVLITVSAIDGSIIDMSRGY